MKRDDPERNSDGESTGQSDRFHISRRGFIGSAAAIPLAASAFASDGAEWDDSDLDFSWNDERTALSVAIRLTATDSSRLEGPAPRFVWTLPLWKFGPNAGLILRNMGASGNREKDYRIRVTGASWGRLIGRPLSFRLIKLRNHKRFLAFADSGFWSTSANPLRHDMFRMGADPAGGDPARPATLVTLRDLCSPAPGDEDRAFHQTVWAERISSTFRVLWNGAVEFTGGNPQETVYLTLGRDLMWRVRAGPRARMTALSRRIDLEQVEFGWVRDDAAGEGEATLGLRGIARPLTAPLDLGSAAAALRLTPAPDAQPMVRLDARFRPTGASEREQPRAFDVRSVVILSADLRVQGPADTATGPLGPHLLRLTETIRAPERPTAANPANQAGLVEVEGWSQDGRSRPVATPAAGMVVESALLVDDPPANGRLVAGRHDRLHEAPFAPMAGATLRARFTWSGARDRAAPPARRIEAVFRLLSLDLGVGEAAFSAWSFPRGDVWLIHDPQAGPADLPPAFVRLGPGPGDLVGRFDLEGARLSVRDDPGVLSLGFRFVDMMLVLRGQGLPELVALTPVCLAPGASATDLRPRLAVEFHPQHLLEETLAIPDPPPLPDALPRAKDLRYDPVTGLERQDDGGRTLTLSQPVEVLQALAALPGKVARYNLRQAILRQKSPPENDTDTTPEANDRRAFAAFAADYARAVRKDRFWSQLLTPLDQGVYIGPYGLDADYMALARSVWAQRHKDAANKGLNDLIAKVAQQVEALSKPERDAVLADPNLALALERQFEQGIAGYAELRTLHRTRLIDTVLNASSPDATPVSALGFELFYFALVTAAEAPAWLAAENLSIEGMRAQASDTLATLGAPDTPPRMGLMRGRLSGPSRLVFRVNCRDGLLSGQIGAAPGMAGTATETRDLPAAQRGTPRLARRRFDLTLQALTSFADMDLSVIDRAETLYRTSPETGRVIDLDPAARLDRLGIPRGPVRASRRMAQIVGTLRPPGAFETAIELPSRLVLSPSQDAVFLTAQPVPSAVFADPDQLPHWPLPTRLWAAEALASTDLGLDPRLRAVYSPDLVPEVLQVHDTGRPPARGFGNHPAFVQPPPGLPRTPMRTPIEAYARHELVLLSSAWGLPVTGNADTNGGVDNRVAMPPSHPVTDLDRAHSLYVPRTLRTRELALTAMGAFFRHDTPFDPPAAARTVDDNRLFPALSVSKWAQTTILGRDVHVEIHEKGYLFPLGHRCVLIRITERGFFRDTDGPYRRGAIRAYLNQRLLLRVLEPTKKFPALEQPLAGRHFPVRWVRFVDLETPDLVDPVEDAPPQCGTSSPRGRLNPGGNAEGLVFWPRTAPLPHGNVGFRLRLEDEPTELPLIFVNNTAADHEPTMRALARYYNGLSTPAAATDMPDRIEHPRTAVLSNATMRYAPEDREGSTRLPSRSWSLAVSGREVAPPAFGNAPGQPVHLSNDDFRFDPVLRSVDQPPFYPVLEEAVVDLRQAERLIGRSLRPVRARLDGLYLADGMPPLLTQTPSPDDGQPAQTRSRLSANSAQVFLTLVDQPELDLQGGGDRVGGIARPGGSVVALSRSLGIMTQAERVDVTSQPAPALSALFSVAPPASGAGEPPADTVPTLTTGGPPPVTPPPVTSLPAPPRSAADVFSKYFGDKAKILGLIKLSDLMKVLDATLDPARDLPELTETLQMGAGNALAAGQDTVDFARRNVIEPLSQTVSRIRSEWQALDRRIAVQLPRLPVDIGAPADMASFAALFPELDRALVDFDIALRNSAGTEDAIAFAASLAQLHAAGKRFLQALEISARDPVERVTQHLRNSLDRFRRQFDRFLTLLETLPRDLLTGLQGTLADAVVDLVLPASAGQGQALFRLPAVLDRPDLASVLEPLLWERDDLRHLLQAYLSAHSDVERRALLRALRIQQLERIDRAIAAAAVIEQDLRQRVEGELRALQHMIAKAITDQQVRFTTEFSAEIAFVHQVFRAGEALHAEVQAGDLHGIVTEARAFVEVFTGPLDMGVLDPDALCREIDRVVEPVRLVLQALAEAGFQRLATADTFRALLAASDAQPAAGDTSLLAQIARLPPRLRALADRFDPPTTLLDLRRPSPAPVEVLNLVVAGLPANQNALVRSLQTQRAALNAASRRAAVALRRTADVAVSGRDVLATGLAPLTLLGSLPERLEFSVCVPGSLAGLKSLPADVESLSQSRRAALDDLKNQITALAQSLRDLHADLGDLVRIWADVEPLIARARSFVSSRAAAAINTALSDLQGVETAVARQVVETLVSLAEALEGLSSHLHRTVRRLQQEHDALFRQWVTVEGLEGILAQLGRHADWLTAYKQRLQAIPATATLAQVLADATAGTAQHPGLSAFVLGVRPGPETLEELARIEGLLSQGIVRFVDALGNQLARIERAGLDTLDELARGVLGARTGGKTLADLHYEYALRTRNRLSDDFASFPAGDLARQPLTVPARPELAYDDVTGDRLDQEQRILDLACGFGGPREGATPRAAKTDPISDRAFLRSLGFVLAGWGDGTAAALQIVRNLERLVRSLLRGEILQAIDLDLLRSMVEEELSRLVPTAIELDFGMDIPLPDNAVRQITGGVFVPDPGTRLEITARTTVQLIEVVRGQTPKVNFHADGRLGPFKIRLIGDAFEAITLTFAEVTFHTDNGGSAQMRAEITDVTLGPKLEFLKQLSGVLSPGNESGPFIEMMSRNAGIKAGYRLFLGDFAIGAVAFFNIRLEAALNLPFDGRDAVISVTLSSRENPFTISYFPYGGSGFLALEADSHGLRSIEASFEFGGAVAFSFGPLSGIGRLMSGIYVRSVTLPDIGRRTEIWATFYVGGTAKLWIFSFEASLYVRMGMVQGNMVGEAIFTYGFSIGFKRFRFRVRVQRGMRQGFQESQNGRVGNSGSLWPPVRYASTGGVSSAGAVIRNVTRGPDRHWQVYRGYFDPFTPPSEVLE